MKAEELYQIIKDQPELQRKYPLLRAFVLTYEVIRTSGGEKNSYEAGGKVLTELSKNPPAELRYLFEGREIALDKEATPEPTVTLAAKEETPVPVELPPLSKQLKTLATSMVDYAKSGFKNVSDEVYNERNAICGGCEFFDALALAGMGRCLKCGCSGVKLKLATSSCPIKKWLPELGEPPTP
jgi:hypothetical protein